MQARHPRAATYAAIWLVWVAARAIALITVDLTPWMLGDLDIYQEWTVPLAEGTFPADDRTWQYPPGIAPLFMLADLNPIDFRWAFTLLILATDALVMAALQVAHVRRPGTRWLGLWLWALAGIIVGSIMMVRFDTVPTLFAVVAVLMVARPALSGASAALGFTVKLWPALMLLIVPRRALPRTLAGFVVTTAVILAGFALVFDDSLSFLDNQQARGLQVESVGAYPYLLFSIIGGQVAFGLRYGSIQVLMSGAEPVGLVLTVFGLAVLALLGWWRLSGRLEDVPPGDVAMTVMLVSVATSRVYSPQFNVWLIGIAAVAMLDARTRLRTVAWIVVALSLLTQVVYPWSATQLVTGGEKVIAVQGLRIIGLLAALAIALWTVLRWSHRAADRTAGVVG